MFIRKFQNKVILLIGILLIFPIILFSQKLIDTLLEKLPKATESEKITIYIQVGKQYIDTDKQKAEEYLKKGLAMARATDNFMEQSIALYNLGKLSLQKGDTARTEDLYKNAEQAAIKANNQNGLYLIYNQLGLIEFARQHFDKAYEYYRKSIKAAELDGSNKKGIGIVALNMSNVYHYWGKYDSAITFQERALNIFEQIQFDQGIATCLNSIGNVYDQLGKYKEAYDYYQKSYSFCKKINDLNRMAIACNNIGNVLAHKNNSYNRNIDSAYYYYSRALELFKQVNNKQGIASSLNNIAVSFSYKQNYAEALKYFQKSYQINKETNNLYETAVNLRAMGETYIAMGQYDKAIEFVTKSLE
ncbi:MAG: tetratricopeptide repeat protein, partial [Bacteroidales bacterium]